MNNNEENLINDSELKRQLIYIDKLKQIINSKFLNKKPLMHIVTYGCAMNSHDSEKLKGILSEIGYEYTEEETSADIIVYNTCCVRENAENRVYGNLGFLKNIKAKNKNLKIIVCGCMMQQDAVLENIKNKYKQVDVIFGTFNTYRFPELLYTNFETNKTVIDVWKEHKEIIEDLPQIREFKYKAFVNIMYGCNNYCTYCIVPYVRGAERSRTTEDILVEVQNLVDDGVIEITLLGQNVNSYGEDLSLKNGFVTLLDKISQIKGLKRIRFLTSHPKDMSQELIKIIKEKENICNHIHLPFQSGSNNVLNKMNRKYTKEDYLELINKIKIQIPEVTLTTDIIVGFPTETEEDFLETIEVCEKVEFITAYSFQYSKRDGTPSANFENHIDDETMAKRYKKLLETLKPISLKINQNYIGKTLKVLVEGTSKTDNTLFTGRTEGNVLVHFKGNERLVGNIVEILINDCKTYYLTGEII